MSRVLLLLLLLLLFLAVATTDTGNHWVRGGAERVKEQLRSLLSYYCLSPETPT